MGGTGRLAPSRRGLDVYCCEPLTWSRPSRLARRDLARRARRRRSTEALASLPSRGTPEGSSPDPQRDPARLVSQRRATPLVVATAPCPARSRTCRPGRSRAPRAGSSDPSRPRRCTPYPRIAARATRDTRRHCSRERMYSLRRCRSHSSPQTSACSLHPPHTHGSRLAKRSRSRVGSRSTLSKPSVRRRTEQAIGRTTTTGPPQPRSPRVDRSSRVVLPAHRSCRHTPEQRGLESHPCSSSSPLESIS